MEEHVTENALCCLVAKQTRGPKISPLIAEQNTRQATALDTGCRDHVGEMEHSQECRRDWIGNAVRDLCLAYNIKQHMSTWGLGDFLLW